MNFFEVLQKWFIISYYRKVLLLTVILIFKVYILVINSEENLLVEIKIVLEAVC